MTLNFVHSKITPSVNWIISNLFSFGYWENYRTEKELTCWDLCFELTFCCTWLYAFELLPLFIGYVLNFSIIFYKKNHLWCLLKFSLHIRQVSWIWLCFFALKMFLVEKITVQSFIKTRRCNDCPFVVQWLIELLCRNILYATSDGNNAISSAPLVSKVFLPCNS